MNETERIIVDEIIARENSIAKMRILVDLTDSLECESSIYDDKETRHKMREIRSWVTDKIEQLETSNNKYWSTLLKKRSDD